MPTRARTKPLSPGKKLTELAKLTTSPPRWKAPSTWRALPMRELHSPPLDDGDDTRVSDEAAATPEVETPESVPSDPAERGERLAMLLGSGFVTVDDVLDCVAGDGGAGDGVDLLAQVPRGSFAQLAAFLHRPATVRQLCLALVAPAAATAGGDADADADADAAAAERRAAAACELCTAEAAGWDAMWEAGGAAEAPALVLARPLLRPAPRDSAAAERACRVLACLARHRWAQLEPLCAARPELLAAVRAHASAGSAAAAELVAVVKAHGAGSDSDEDDGGGGRDRAAAAGGERAAAPPKPPPPLEVGDLGWPEHLLDARPAAPPAAAAEAVARAPEADASPSAERDGDPDAAWGTRIVGWLRTPRAAAPAAAAPAAAAPEPLRPHFDRNGGGGGGGGGSSSGDDGDSGDDDGDSGDDDDGDARHGRGWAEEAAASFRRAAAEEALDEEALDEAFFEALRPSALALPPQADAPGDGGGRDDEDDELKEELGWTTRQRVGARSREGSPTKKGAGGGGFGGVR